MQEQDKAAEVRRAIAAELRAKADDLRRMADDLSTVDGANARAATWIYDEAAEIHATDPQRAASLRALAQQIVSKED